MTSATATVRPSRPPRRLQLTSLTPHRRAVAPNDYAAPSRRSSLSPSRGVLSSLRMGGDGGGTPLSAPGPSGGLSPAAPRRSRSPSPPPGPGRGPMRPPPHPPLVYITTVEALNAHVSWSTPSRRQDGLYPVEYEVDSRVALEQRNKPKFTFAVSPTAKPFEEGLTPDEEADAEQLEKTRDARAAEKRRQMDIAKRNLSAALDRDGDGACDGDLDGDGIADIAITAAETGGPPQPAHEQRTPRTEAALAPAPGNCAMPRPPRPPRAFFFALGFAPPPSPSAAPLWPTAGRPAAAAGGRAPPAGPPPASIIAGAIGPPSRASRHWP